MQDEKCLTAELIKAEEIPKDMYIKKMRAYVDVTELYQKTLQYDDIEPQLIDTAVKDFFRRKVAEI